MTYKVLQYSETRKNDGYIDQSAYSVEETFATYGEAKRFWNSLSVSKDWRTEWDVRNAPWLSMKNVWECKSLDEYADNEYVQTLDFEEFGYPNFKAFEDLRERWEGEGWYWIEGKVDEGKAVWFEWESQIEDWLPSNLDHCPEIKYYGDDDVPNDPEVKPDGSVNW